MTPMKNIVTLIWTFSVHPLPANILSIICLEKNFKLIRNFREDNKNTNNSYEILQFCTDTISFIVHIWYCRYSAINVRCLIHEYSMRYIRNILFVRKIYMIFINDLWLLNVRCNEFILHQIVHIVHFMLGSIILSVPQFTSTNPYW